MKLPPNWMVLPLLFLAAPTVSGAAGKAIQFCGYDWSVRTGKGGPGPNLWDESSVWVDAAGSLHLKIAHREGQWLCAEVTLQKRLGFGRYEFQVSGRIDRLDDNVVLGLFNYPTADVGRDGTYEIDIEFARWGQAKNPIGNYTVWPVDKSLKQQSKSFSFDLQNGESTHRFTWDQRQILFQSVQGIGKDETVDISRWLYSPDAPAARIAQQPMPVHINLWLFKGLPPKDGSEVEVVIRSFRFEPRTD